jgi:hypothetical protein
MKFAADCYLDFVFRQFHTYEQLAPNFLALSCRSAMRSAGYSQRVAPHLGVVEFLLYNQGNQARFPCDVRTEDNLSSEVLKNLLLELGLSCDDYWAGKFLLIDGSLLKNRNAIAHGDNASIDDATYQQLRTLVFELLDYAQTCIENAVQLRGYLRKEKC